MQGQFLADRRRKPCRRRTRGLDRVLDRENFSFIRLLRAFCRQSSDRQDEKQCP